MDREIIKFSEDRLSVAEYLTLRRSVGWPTLTERQAELAIENSMYQISAYNSDGKLVGMGRIVGDGAVICYVQDLIVLPEYHGIGIGSALMTHLKSYVSSLTTTGEKIMLALMCAKGRESFYQKNGFISRPTDTLGPGMILYIQK